MPLEININIKVEDLDRVVKVVENLVKLAPVVQAEVKSGESKEVKKVEAEVKAAPVKKSSKKDVTEISEAEVVAPKVEPAKEEIPVKAEAEVTLDDLRRLGHDISVAGKTAEVLALLNKYGVKSLSNIKPEERASFYAEAKQLVG